MPTLSDDSSNIFIQIAIASSTVNAFELLILVADNPEEVEYLTELAILTYFAMLAVIILDLLCIGITASARYYNDASVFPRSQDTAENDGEYLPALTSHK
jgi:uncharacterized membrane protein